MAGLVYGAQGGGGERLAAWLGEGYRAPLALCRGEGWAREAIKINSTPPFELVWVGWVPDVIWWPRLLMPYSVFSPLMDCHEYLNPAFRGQAWCVYFSYSCDSLALQCEISGVRVTLAEYRMSNVNQETVQVCSEKLQTKINNSCKMECIENSNWPWNWKLHFVQNN